MIYETCDGDKYDLSELPEKHLDFIRRLYLYYLNNMEFCRFSNLITSPDSIVMQLPNPTETPLYAVASDLQARLLAKQELALKDWEGDIDPEWPLTE